jgi:hypothetical protein
MEQPQVNDVANNGNTFSTNDFSEVQNNFTYNEENTQENIQQDLQINSQHENGNETQNNNDDSQNNENSETNNGDSQNGQKRHADYDNDQSQNANEENEEGGIQKRMRTENGSSNVEKQFNFRNKLELRVLLNSKVSSFEFETKIKRFLEKKFINSISLFFKFKDAGAVIGRAGSNIKKLRADVSICILCVSKFLRF